MDWHRIRRFIHVLAPLLCIYYIVPDTPLPGAPKDQIILLIMLVVLALDTMRLIARFKVPILHTYEDERPSAPAFFAVSAAIALLYFPVEITLPVLLGMGLVDPLVGELRMRKSDLNPILPMAVYFFILLIGLGYFYGLSFLVLLSCVLVAPIALFLESRRFPYIDDDMILVLVPLFLLALMFGQLPF
ncbi:MAG TPA: hypothetical protein P5202_03135 [Methanomassiliicoccales archaeon]|nr:hypothetical protein [Methanomassiliicoccales archaeon]